MYKTLLVDVINCPSCAIRCNCMQRFLSTIFGWGFYFCRLNRRRNEIHPLVSFQRKCLQSIDSLNFCQTKFFIDFCWLAWNVHGSGLRRLMHDMKNNEVLPKYYFSILKINRRRGILSDSWTEDGTRWLLYYLRIVQRCSIWISYTDDEHRIWRTHKADIMGSACFWLAHRLAVFKGRDGAFVEIVLRAATTNVAAVCRLSVDLCPIKLCVPIWAKYRQTNN